MRFIEYHLFINGLCENSNFLLSVMEGDSPFLKLLNLDNQMFVETANSKNGLYVDEETNTRSKRRLECLNFLDEQEGDNKRFVNLFNVRILGLLICRGSVTRKAGLMYDLILEPFQQIERAFMKNGEIIEIREKCSDKTTVVWSSMYLRKVLKDFMYISELLARKYVYQYKKEDWFIETLDKTLKNNITSKQSIVDNTVSELTKDQQQFLLAQCMKRNRSPVTWTDQYFEQAEAQFETIFEYLYHEYIIEKIFDQSLIDSKEIFVNKFTNGVFDQIRGSFSGSINQEGSGFKMPEALKDRREVGWIFSP